MDVAAERTLIPKVGGCHRIFQAVVVAGHQICTPALRSLATVFLIDRFVSLGVEEQTTVWPLGVLIFQWPAPE
jgi:hypothetical protein